MAQPAPQKTGVARSKRTDDPALGKVIAGRYRLEARVGEGGMGIVYRARHVLIDRVVAVKLIRPDLRGETHLRAWMLREARAANRVDHAHIIDIHDIGETDDGELYLVMEYLVGTPLSSELARGPLALTRGVDILEQMGAALSRAHDLGVVHRDLKSDNILLTARGGRKDFVKILDFGLAALAHDPRLAPKGAVFGTPEYMSPEQARGEQAGPQSDLYALGVLFFEMLTGQLPFRAGDRETLLEMQRTAPAPRPQAIKKDTHPTAERIVLRLLEKDPRKRYRDGHHLLEELKALQRSLPSTSWDKEGGSDAAPAAAPPPPPPPKTPGVVEWANRAESLGQGTRAIYEQAGAAQAMVEAQRQWIKTRETKRVAREAGAGDLRRQIEELRGQLARYAEALEEDLASGREKVAARAREGLKYEKLFLDSSSTLLTHLKGKPECRDLMNELTTGGAAGETEGTSAEGDVPAAGAARPADG